MMQHYKYSLYDLEHMIPWEREIYVVLLDQYIKEENARIKRENEKQRGR
tara:strand:+ start:2250 stop:2396 length:147 start_codon:yes stop_codon:yes gene_type:complete